VQDRSHSDEVVTEERLEALRPDLGRLSSLGSDYRPRAGLGGAGSSALWEGTSGEVPSSVILYASGQEDLSESIERHREVSPDKPSILVFGPHLDLALVRDALRAGASGFVHAGMTPNQLLRAVAVATKDELGAPRELFKYLLSERGAGEPRSSLRPPEGVPRVRGRGALQRRDSEAPLPLGVHYKAASARRLQGPGGEQPHRGCEPLSSQR